VVRNTVFLGGRRNCRTSRNFLGRHREPPQEELDQQSTGSQPSPVKVSPIGAVDHCCLPNGLTRILPLPSGKSKRCVGGDKLFTIAYPCRIAQAGGPGPTVRELALGCPLGLRATIVRGAKDSPEP